jgi:hypothetical protein
VQLLRDHDVIAIVSDLVLESSVDFCGDHGFDRATIARLTGERRE